MCWCTRTRTNAHSFLKAKERFKPVRRPGREENAVESREERRESGEVEMRQQRERERDCRRGDEEKRMRRTC